jgi:hypothetical protein
VTGAPRSSMGGKNYKLSMPLPVPAKLSARGAFD